MADRQLEMFPPAPPTLDEQLAEMRLEQMRRDETKPGRRTYRGRRAAKTSPAAVRCPTCGRSS